MRRLPTPPGKLLMIGFVRRYGNDARVLKDFVDAGTWEKSTMERPPISDATVSLAAGLATSVTVAADP